MKSKAKTGYNIEAVKSLTEKQFVEQHPHIEDAAKVYKELTAKPAKEDNKQFVIRVLKSTMREVLYFFLFKVSEYYQ